MGQQWIAIDKIQSLITLEMFILFYCLICGGFLFYKLFLKKISLKRHNNLKERFKVTLISMMLASVLSFIHWNLFNLRDANYLHVRIGTYLGLLTLLVGAYSLVKIVQIYVYLYLFFSNMSHGVPRLIANMFTFAFSIVIVGFIASNIFGIHLSAVLASSAIFSLILGLALQDTLGNLFSGVALQIDKPFEIGDWLEILQGPDRLVGQVQEITWRATYLLGFGDETILIPNRTIAQSQMLIFSKNHRPPRFNQTLRVDYQSDIVKIKKIILDILNNDSQVLKETEPRVLITETQESYLLVKYFYSLSDYGLRYRVGDILLNKVLQAMSENDIKLANPKIQLIEK